MNTHKLDAVIKSSTSEPSSTKDFQRIINELNCIADLTLNRACDLEEITDRLKFQSSIEAMPKPDLPNEASDIIENILIKLGWINHGLDRIMQVVKRQNEII